MKIPYGKHNITEDDLEAVKKALLSDFITQGPNGEEFEKVFAEYVGAKYAISLSNGTAALDLCVKVLDPSPGDKYITTPITFVASANCAKFNDGEVHFSDIDRKTYLLDLNRLEDLLKKEDIGSYKAVIPVDFAGFPVNMQDLNTLAEKYKFHVIEDACHAPGGEFLDSVNKWQRCGNGVYADLTVFSFHPVKHLATGEGGMITTNDKDLYDRIRRLRSHGITKDSKYLTENHGDWYYEMHELSHNYRLTDFQAALGISQLKRADEGLRRRTEIAAKYISELGHIDDITFPLLPSNIKHAYHLFIIEVPNRKEFYDYLKLQGIFAQIHYIPVHLQPYYRQFGTKKGDFPEAEDYYEHCISLPMYPSLSEDEQNYVIEKIKKYFIEE